MPGRVLVVDDLEPNVKLLQAKLTNEYYDVTPCYSGVECLKIVKDVKPDIILLDVMMPELDGFETCRRLKADPDTAYIPVVMVTALGEQKDRVQGLEAGANDFLTKPVDEIHLMARVRSLIRLKLMIDELRMRDKTGLQLGMEANETLVSEKSPPAADILIIDDDVVQSKQIVERLGSFGHRVSSTTPEDALSAVAEKDFDLVIISTMLDDADGLRLGTQIRSQEKTRQIPIMIIVDEDDKPLLIKGLDIGIDDYVISPIDYNELIARVKTQVRRKKYQDALRSDVAENLAAAIIDQLTKLYNRRYLDTHLSTLVQEAHQKGTPLSLMTLDIDHFKAVNDRPGWGHHIGDEVLIEVAKRIKSCLRTIDLATRPGGEEFVVVMPGAEIYPAKDAAERIRKAMEGTPISISAEPGHLTCTVSIGVATLEAGDTPQTLLQKSDKALYEAKETGRNQVCLAA